MAKFSFIGHLSPTDTTPRIMVDEKFDFEMHTGGDVLETGEFKDDYVFWIYAGSDDSGLIGSVRFSLQEAIYLNTFLNRGIKKALRMRFKD